MAIANIVFAIAAVAVVSIAGVSVYLLYSGGSGGAGTQTNISYTNTMSVRIESGGSSFVNPVMQLWILAYVKYTGFRATIDYQSVGSGAGQQGLLHGLFDFAGSDAPFTRSQLANQSRTMLQIPETLGAVAIFYNNPDIGNVSLKFSGQVLDQIWSQKITQWDDPTITSLNPGVHLTHQAIVPIHRADGSGTTFALTTYFSRIDPNWNSTIGVGTSVNWPTSELGARGSAGMAGSVQQTQYSIGYVDQYYAANSHLQVAQIKNQAGNFIAPSLTTVSAAAADYVTQLQTNPTFSITNAPGPNSYPISTFTYLLVWKDQTDSNKGYALAHFFWWIVHDGQALGSQIYYPPLPSEVIAVDDTLIKQLSSGGTPIIS